MLAIRPKILLDSIESTPQTWRIYTDEVEDKGSRGVPLPKLRPWVPPILGEYYDTPPKGRWSLVKNTDVIKKNIDNVYIPLYNSNIKFFVKEFQTWLKLK